MSKPLDPSNTTRLLSPGQVPDYSGVGGAFTLAALAIAGAAFAVHHYVLQPHKQEAVDKFIPVFLNSPKAQMESCKSAVTALQKAVKSPWQIGAPEKEFNQAHSSCNHYKLECELRYAGDKNMRDALCQPRKLGTTDMSALADLKKIPAFVPAADKAACESAVAEFASKYETHRTKYEMEYNDLDKSFSRLPVYCSGKAAYNALRKLTFNY